MFRASRYRMRLWIKSWRNNFEKDNHPFITYPNNRYMITLIHQHFLVRFPCRHPVLFRNEPWSHQHPPHGRPSLGPGFQRSAGCDPASPEATVDNWWQLASWFTYCLQYCSLIRLLPINLRIHQKRMTGIDIIYNGPEKDTVKTIYHYFGRDLLFSVRPFWALL